MKISEIRDLIITGSYMIGADGLREPAHGWKYYANKLEETLAENNGVLPIVSGSTLLPEGFRIYKCPNCGSINVKRDNREIRVGFCDECEHPIFN